MFKHIAVGLDGSSHAAAAEELAFGLAASLGAVVHGIHVIDASFLEGAFITDISGAMGFEPFLNLQSQVRSTLEDVGSAIRTRFEDRAQNATVEGQFTLERAGVVRGILTAARLADLLVVGQRGVNARFHEDALGPTTASLLRRSPIPVLVVPEQTRVPQRPLVAYDGSAKSGRALALAAGLCQSLNLPLAVVTVDEDTARARQLLKEAGDYLAPYGLQADLHKTADAQVETALLAHTTAGRFDILCVGAHGHARAVELVLGSTTDFLARRSEIPVLCATTA